MTQYMTTSPNIEMYQRTSMEISSRKLLDWSSAADKRRQLLEIRLSGNYSIQLSPRQLFCFDLYSPFLGENRNHHHVHGVHTSEENKLILKVYGFLVEHIWLHLFQKSSTFDIHFIWLHFTNVCYGVNFRDMYTQFITICSLLYFTRYIS